MTFDARDLARDAALESADEAGHVGSFIDVEYSDENRIATYLFESKVPGYHGWRWCITVARVD